MNAAVCACGFRVERTDPYPAPGFSDLEALGHNPVECSRSVGYEDRLRGAAAMVDIVMEHLAERRLSGVELAEIRRELSARVKDVLR